MQDVLPQVIESGASTGGARPKQRIAIPPEDPDTVWYGKGLPPPGYHPWLLKIETDPLRQYGLVEEAYYRMARRVGVHVPETRLIGASPGAVRHFAVRRFDWLGEGRLHCHTLSGLLNRDSHAGSTDYDEFLRVVLEVTGDQRDVTEAFRRMIFNVSFGVRDDHAKNHAFTMDAAGTWRLSPAYDVTYSRPGVGNGLHRQMPVRGKRRDIARSDIAEIAAAFGIGKRMLTDMFESIHKAATEWPDVCRVLGISDQRRDEIADTWEFPGPDFTW
jgi:serine/threonine-protein kinase HipA